MNHIKSLRDYLEALRAIGELQEIDREVDWNLEIGAIVRRSYDLRAPAPLFNNIKNSDPGFRVFGAPGGVSAQPGLYLARIALSLGLAPTASGQEIIETLAASRSKSYVPPHIVDTGPCKENILQGDQVDLTRLPFPLIHDGDGGRYVNTVGTVIVRSPDGRWTNWSVARIMLKDERRMVGIVSPLQHLGKIHAMWAKEGKDTPFALALGVEPAIPFVSGMPIPDWVSEADYIGGHFGEPIEVVPCETVPLEVPATAEVVIEGYLSRDEKAPEGPMGEYAGYIWKGNTTDKPIYHVTALTHRNDAIIPICVAGEPVEEDHTMWGIPAAAEVLYELRQAHLPVTMAWSPLETAVHWMVVTVRQTWREETGLNAQQLCERIGNVVFGNHVGEGFSKVLLMEDDVDPTNTNEVVWAYATRCHPGTGEIVLEHEATSGLAIYLTQTEKNSFLSKKSVFNCLSSEEWTKGRTPSRLSFRHGWSPAIQERVLTNWTAYGYAEAIAK